ncbi:tyrosine--tRNA ligase [Candidatus Gottesmanbacteria bacterium RIFCSPLOWO2_01_FULL_43_11b]|uniref:Tyrosine--tRNA ligase n=1 Tax=Candidatus Gottesmanbacteria bacterium RIFCSPLOWO2_01_FULL_43_11b TaxID=1798392 RepID=A0A1F6AHD6_9BACT|nr:MAG: tyrosine--tRNA ligase [Candidatus Gottesmanbacteria bacterium RIFCSPLOWO2_01_FULL_43_11b]
MDNVEELLTRGVENIIPNKEKLRKLLESGLPAQAGKKLNIYLGIDPTATQIHIGHAVPLRKLNAFAQLGHNVTFLIGDFTALIGDTSDKDSERPVLTSEQIKENFQTYKKQAEKVLDFSKVKVRFNSEWLKDLKFADIVKLCQHFSAGDFVGRELIKKRLQEGKKVGLHELLYPVMQGYDSYFMDTDIQLGGTDQTFNMQAGRVFQKDLRNKESFIIANGFLDGTDGRKMSKTWNNAIWLTDEPNDMFGKVMSLSDTLIVSYFTLATNASIDEIESVKKRLSSKENPMKLKIDLAHRMVTELHSKALANAAQNEFERVHQKGDTQSVSAPTLKATAGLTLTDALITGSLVQSKSEVKRLLQQKAIEQNGVVVTNDTKVSAGDILRIGKKKFLKLV